MGTEKFFDEIVNTTTETRLKIFRDAEQEVRNDIRAAASSGLSSVCVGPYYHKYSTVFGDEFDKILNRLKQDGFTIKKVEHGRYSVSW